VGLQQHKERKKMINVSFFQTVKQDCKAVAYRCGIFAWRRLTDWQSGWL